MGNMQKEQGRLQEAAVSYKKAIELTPTAEIHCNLADVLKELEG